MKGYVDLAKAIVIFAKRDVMKNNVYSDDARKFLESEWGKSLIDFVDVHENKIRLGILPQNIRLAIN